MGQKILPPALAIGDTIRIVPTARAIQANELEHGIALAESWGLNVELAQNVGSKRFQQGGSDTERANALNAALRDEHVKAIWCARGGYGSVRILDGIDLGAFRRSPKWIIGFSDISALHNYSNKLGIASIHAQMPFAVEKKSANTVESLRRVLFEGANEIECAHHALNRTGSVEAELVGGNLSVLYSLRGGRYDLDVDGKILFLEDLDELLYHVDRMFQNLRTAGWGQKVAGVIVGGMTDMWDKNEKDPFGSTVEEMVLEVFGERDIPVCFDFPAGHARENQAMIFGNKAKLSISTQGTKLSFTAKSSA